MKITMEEWLTALQALQPSNPDGWTTMELAKVFGHTPMWVRERVIRPLLESGKLVCGTRRGTTIDGRPCNHPIYILKSSEVATDEKITEPPQKEKLLNVDLAVPNRGRRRISNDRQRKAAK